MSAVRFAVFGLLDKEAARHVRTLQRQLSAKTGNCTAIHFPVHITIRGRFWAGRDLAVRCFRQFAEGVPSCQVSVELTGPGFQSPDLIWLSVNAASDVQSLARMHRNADESLRGIVERDEVLPEYAGGAFMPHVTLGWGCSEEDVRGLANPPVTNGLKAKILSLALVEYPSGWPIHSEVQVVDSVSLKPG